jgi:AcrR family transcriptional regulator
MSEASTKIDGRRKRTGVTRQRLLDASRELILAGTLEPTAREIASRADITTRTLFRHFPDMESLYQELVEDAQSRAQAVMDEPFPETIASPDKWREQLALVVERRTRIYEYLLPVFISSIFQRHRAETPVEVMRKSLARRRKRLKQVLPAKVISDDLLLDAIDGILSIEFWISLRQDQRLTPLRAAKVVHRAVKQMTASH